jgi:hypothetical protein
MTRGDQRDRDRDKALKKCQESKKSTTDVLKKKGMSLSHFKEQNAQIMRAKQKESETKKKEPQPK